ncbi:MAG: hypothetical protein HeimC3_20000 [Candidatus Heimdallarchaeota archaeon LC_3]|nr:MAG: hypothetical protein HeimC3_20000 [Candidatus Heimdallarchaeota archaeon LC_3]
MSEYFLRENENLILPDSLRNKLAEPFGILYGEENKISPEKQLQPLLAKFENIIVSVGDVVTDSLLSIDIFPNFGIIDYNTLRGEYKGSDFTDYKKFKITNPPATITYNSWKTIKNLYKSFKEDIKSRKNDLFSHSKKINTIIVVVDGEEDLLVIPCIIEAPIGSLILYGQPNKGIIVITVSEELKQSTIALVKKFNKKTSVQS